MKTISRMIRRYVTAAFGSVLLIFIVNVILFLGMILYFGSKNQTNGYFRVGTFAESFVQAEDGSYGPETEDWKKFCAWAMLLSDSGEILWSEDLPENLNHAYTVPEVAAFSRWYLDDYPVMVYRNAYGLVVAGRPRNSITRFDFYSDNDVLDAVLAGFVPLLVLDGVLILLVCLWLSWRAARPLLNVARGIDSLAEGKPVRLPEKGVSAELAEKLNRTSEHLQRQTELIERRDNARTNWISGVSHDIRTPLSLIMGYSEQLGRDEGLSPVQKQKAILISDQSQKIRSLIEDLNLTSKLQYHAQPLRLEKVTVGPLLRQCVADFCNSGLADHCEVSFALSEEVNQLRLELDVPLFSRAVENLLNNSARHNAAGCEILIHGCITKERFRLIIQDNGVGYSEKVLALLRCQEVQEKDENAPHILGLHLVRQIAEAHGGEADFGNDGGAVAEIVLPAVNNGE